MYKLTSEMYEINIKEIGEMYNKSTLFDETTEHSRKIDL